MENVAKLPHPNFSEQPVTKITPQAERVMRFFETTSDANFQIVEPMRSTQDLHTIMRDDSNGKFPEGFAAVRRTPPALMEELESDFLSASEGPSACISVVSRGDLRLHFTIVKVFQKQVWS